MQQGNTGMVGDGELSLGARPQKTEALCTNREAPSKVRLQVHNLLFFPDNNTMKFIRGKPSNQSLWFSTKEK